MRIRLLKSNWKRWLIIVTCIALVIVQQIWPHIQFNLFSIGLLVIAAIFFIMPNPYIIFSYIKRVKLWDTEIELHEKVIELNDEVNKAVTKTRVIPTTASLAILESTPDGKDVRHTESPIDDSKIDISYKASILKSVGEINVLLLQDKIEALHRVSSEIEKCIKIVAKAKYNIDLSVTIDYMLDSKLAYTIIQDFGIFPAFGKFVDTKSSFLELYKAHPKPPRQYIQAWLYISSDYLYEMDRYLEKASLDLVSNGIRLLEIISEKIDQLIATK